MLKEIFKIQNYALYLVNMGFLGMAVAVTMPFLIIYMTGTYDITTTQFGLFMAAAAMCSFVVNSVVGRKSDHISFDRKYLIVAALISLILAFLSFLIFENIMLVVIGYVIFASLGAPAMPQLYARARESINDYEPKLAVFSNTVLRSTFSLGFLFGPLVGTLLLTMYGFDGLFTGTVLFFIVVLILTLMLRKSAQAPAERSLVSMQSAANYQAPSMANLNILVPFIAFTFLQVSMFMYNLNMPLYVTEVLGRNEGAVGIIASLCAGLEVPLMILVGYVAGRFAAKNLLIFGGFFGTFYLLLIAIFENYTLMLIGQVPFAIYLAIMLGLGISYFQELVPRFPGFASTLFANGMIFGQLIGNLLGGALSDVLGVENIFFVAAGFIGVAMIMLVFTKTGLKEGEI